MDGPSVRPGAGRPQTSRPHLWLDKIEPGQTPPSIPCANCGRTLSTRRAPWELEESCSHNCHVEDRERGESPPDAVWDLAPGRWVYGSGDCCRGPPAHPPNKGQEDFLPSLIVCSSSHEEPYDRPDDTAADAVARVGIAHLHARSLGAP